MIRIEADLAADPMVFQVTVTGDGAETHHHVTLSREALTDIFGPACPPVKGVEAAFRFLLDREPKESILPNFDITLISRYFPEFRTEITTYIDNRRA